MSTAYNARAQLSTPIDDAHWDALLEQLADFHPAVGRSLFGRTEVTITLTTDTLRQAMASSYALLQEAAGDSYVISFEVLPTADFDREHDLQPVPELVSVTQAAEELAVSRQAVLQRIESGSLPATRIGTTWAIPQSAIAQVEALQQAMAAAAEPAQRAAAQLLASMEPARRAAEQIGASTAASRAQGSRKAKPTGS